MTSPQVAIVTGASSGIGRETARVLAEEGFAVMLLARREEKLRELAAEIRAEYRDAPQAVVLPTDVCDPDAIARAVRRTLDVHGRIDAVANVAGDAPLLPIEKITPEIWRQCIDSNLSSTVLMTAAVWPTFQAQKRGVIVNVSSMSSIDPFRGFSMYAAAKIGVNMFTKCAADEGKTHNIRTVALALGAVETPMLRRNFDTSFLPAELAAPPVKIAGIIRDCMLGKRDFTSGQTIVLNDEG